MGYHSPCDFIKPKVNSYNSDPLIDQLRAPHVLWPVTRLDFRVEEKSRRAGLFVLLTAIALYELGAITRVWIHPVTSTCT